MIHLNRTEVTNQSPMTNIKVTEWESLLHELYHASDIPELVKTDDFGSFNLKRKHLPCFSMTKIESCFSEDIAWSERNPARVFSMFFMLKGDLQLSLQDWKSQLKSGENNILLIPEHSQNRAVFKANIPYSYRMCILHDDYLKNLANLYPEVLEDLYRKYENGELSSLDQFNRINTCAMNLIISQLDHAFLLGSAEHLFIEAKILELLSLQVKSCQKDSFKNKATLKGKDFDKVREAKHLLIEDLHKTPSIKKLSKIVSMNEKKLMKGFKQLYQNTIFGYLLDYKMNLAQELLLNTDKTVFEIRVECGYDYPSHFSTAFKRRFGLTPLQFRNSR